MSNNSSASELAALTGLGTAKRIVAKLAQHTELTGAVMFYGSDGAGKRTLAAILAKSWLCVNPTGEGACGDCKPCHAFEHGNSVDVLRIRPHGASALITIAQIRGEDADSPEISIETFFRTHPLAAKRKVVIIESADRMNGPAANALLKTLEEPPPFAKLILTTTRVGSILPTVLSRCLTVQCEIPKAAQYEDVGLSPRLLRAEEGGIGKKRLVQDHLEWYQAMSDFAEALRRRNRGAALLVAEEFQTLCTRRESEFEEGARVAKCESLKVLANLLDSRAAGNDHGRLIAAAHRKIQGNGNAGMALDALFANLLR